MECSSKAFGELGLLGAYEYSSCLLAMCVGQDSLLFFQRELIIE